jgi:hypothetical protein
MKIMTRRPTPATIIALVALFVALGGVGLAANGQSLILGSTSNSATASTRLTAATTDPALSLTNSGAGAPLKLNAPASVPPLIVSNGIKVASLNADKLDGLDSNFFLPRTGKATDADKLDGMNSTSFLPLANLTSLDGKPCTAIATDGTGDVPGGLSLYFAKSSTGDGLGVLVLHCLTRDKYEPNDSEGAAVGVVGSANAATISPTGDDDWYTGTCHPVGLATHCTTVAAADLPNAENDLVCDGNVDGVAFTGCLQTNTSDGQTITLHVSAAQPSTFLSYQFVVNAPM